MKSEIITDGFVVRYDGHPRRLNAFEGLLLTQQTPGLWRIFNKPQSIFTAEELEHDGLLKREETRTNAYTLTAKGERVRKQLVRLPA